MKIKRSIIAFISVLSIIMSQIIIIPTVVAQETNYATSAQVSATAQLSNYDISRVIDGITSQSEGGSKTAITSFDSMGYGYYELTFSEANTINFLKLYFNQVEAKQRPRDIAIDVKRKDGVYIRVAEMHNIDYAIKSNGYGEINQLDFIFEEIECVSVRITGNRQRTRDINNEQTANYNFRLMEIELFNRSNITEDDYTGTTADSQEKYNIPVPAPVLENLFANMEVSSSLQLSNYSVSRLTNGYKSISSDCSITSFNTANISYSEIILNGETELNQVRLYFSQYEPKQRPKDIAIDVRLKNGVYVRVAEMHNIDYNIISGTASVNTLDFKFENTKAVAVRISGNRQRTRDVNNEPTASYNFRLVEVEGYLNTTLLEEDLTGTQKDIEEKYNIAVPDPLLENLALNQTVIANKELTAGNITYSASNLNDGNKNYNAGTETNAITKWNTSKTAYFEVQFEETTKINRLGVFLTKWQKEYLPKDLAVDVQLANGVYIRVAEMHDINYDSKENLVFSFNEVDAVAVRLTGSCARNSSSENFRLMELEVYYYPDMPEELFTGTTKDENDLYNISVPDPVLINVALDKDVTANEILAAGNVTYEAKNLTDGNSDYSAETEFNAITKWNNTTKLGYFEVDLGEKILINRTKIFLTKWQKEYLPLDIAVDVRLESGVYIRVAEMHNIDYNGKEVLTFSFDEVEAVAFRVTGNCARNESSENFRLMELEAYYYPDMPAELITGTQKDTEEKYNIPVPDPVLDNLAAGKKVTANETLKVLDITYDANFLTDGNKNYFAGTETNAITKWNNTTKMGYYEVDFGKNTKFNRVAVFLAQWQKESLPKEIAIDVRLANGTYKRVAEMHDINYTDVKQLTFSFEDIEAVAFRVTGNCARNESSENFRLMELEAYYYPDMPAELITGTQKDTEEKYNIPVPDPVLDNLAAGKKVTANETLKVLDITYDANFLTDGNKNYFAGTETNAITKWNNTTKMGYYEVYFGKNTKFNRVAVFLAQWQKESLPKEIAIDVRLANGTYKRVAEMHDINYTDVKQLTFSFEDIEAVAFRVTGNCARNEKSENFRLMELEAYYYPDMPAELITGTQKDTEEKYNIPVPDPVLDNLAAGKKVTANETLKVLDITYDANFLTDGNKNYFAGTETNAITKWNNTTKMGYYEVDFGKNTEFNRVAVFLAQWQKESLPKEIAIDVRLANGTYKRVAEMHDISYTDVKQLMFSFEDIEAVAFRVTGNCARNEKSENFRLMELEAYYYPDMPAELITGTKKDKEEKYNIPVPDPVLDNLAAGKKVTANETIVVEKFAYDANFLTDGNNNYFAGTETNAITRYNSSTDCAWFEVDFGEITKFNRIAVFVTRWQKEFLPKDMAIDVRLENGVYVRVAEMHDINYTDVKQLTFSFEEMEAVAFRVTGKRTRNEQSDNFRLMELEAYYYPGMPKEEITGTKKDANEDFNIDIPDPMLKNLALGMQATANDELKANDVFYAASRLTDGFSKYNCDSATAYTAITRWIEGKKLGWFEIAFKEATLFNQVKLCLTHWEKEFLPLDIAIDAKLENGNYVRVAEMHNIDYSGKQELVFYFPEQKAVSFRVVGNAYRNEKSYNFRLIEIEAFYWPGLPTEKYTGTSKDANELYNINDKDLIPSEKDKNTTNNTNKEPITSTGVPLDIGSIQNNTNEESKFEMSSMEYLILFVVAAGFVLLAFMGGSSAVLVFISRKLKPVNKTQSIN